MDDATHKPGAGFSKKVLASAVGLTVVATLGLTLTLSNLLNRGADQTTPSADASQQAPITDDAAAHDAKKTSDEPSVCGLDEAQMTGAVKLAPETTWTLPGRMAAPFVEGHGPGVIEDDGYRYCYSRTPTGALLAAANLWPMGAIIPDISPKLDERSTVPGPGREAAKNQPPDPTTGPTSLKVQIAGFRILDYNGDTADVNIAFQRNDGVMASQIFNMQWAEGDWKFRLGEDGEHENPPSQIYSLEGFAKWSGA